MATNAYGQTYSGNDDFRGYLAANNPNYLAYVGNDGNVNQGAIDANNASVAGGGIANKGGLSPNTLVSAKAIQDAYSAWNSARVATPPTGGATGKPLATAAVNNTQLAIDQIPGILAAALGNEDQTYSNTRAGYDASEQQQQKTYNGSTDTNQNNYDSNYMASIRAGIKGLGGLVNILRGGGAAGGTAEDQVRDTVGGVTADDIRSGADTRDQNQSALDSTLAGFLTDLKGKRQAADDTHFNNVSAINRDSNTQLQDLWTKMAGYYGDAGQTDKANEILGRAGSLTPTIAANTRTRTSAYDTTPVAVQAPQLTAFAAPSQPNVASIPQDGQVGSGIFSMARKKVDDTSNIPVAAPVGA